MFSPDFKPERRISDRTATKRACLRWPYCLICEKPCGSGHHVLPKGRGSNGDDVLENIVPLCGTGTTGCHGLVTARDRATLVKLGDAIREHRPDVLAYLRRKLGLGYFSWLERNLYL